MDRIEVVAGLEAALVERVVARLRELEADAIAVLVSGSYAKGKADEQSDLDVTVVVRGNARSRYRMWFEERPGAPALHVSPSVRGLETCLAERTEPEDWAFGFPVRNVTRYVWATDEARAALGDSPEYVHPPAEPELEDFVEFVQKVRRAARADEPTLARLYAHEAALRAPCLLRSLNPERVVRDRGEALNAALALEVAPEHFRQDLLACLGLVDAGDAEVGDAALRLARELLAFLRERAPDADPQPDIAGYLADGSLERHLEFEPDGV